MSSGIWDIEVGGTSPYTIQGNWNAATNSPDLSGVTDAGYAWIVINPGSTSLGGLTGWLLNDIAIKTKTGWARSRPSGTTWGAVTGTLTDQTDLLNALNLKATIASVALKQDKPTTATEHNVAWFDDNKDTEDSGLSISTSQIASPGSDSLLPTEKAIRLGLEEKQDRPATAIENNIASFDANKDTKDSGLSLVTTIADPGTDAHLPSEKAIRSELTARDILLYNELGNGIKSGFTISINTDPTKINISTGKGIISDAADPEAPSFTKISYMGANGIAVDGIATSNATYIAVDDTGTIIQQTTEFTPAQRRTLLILGAAVHSNRSYINVVNNLPDVALHVVDQLNDLMDSLKNFNVSGNVISPNGANLSINKSLGYLFKKGSNFKNDPLNPHVLTLAALTAPSNIRYRLRDGTEYADTAFIDPNYYDLNGVKTPVSESSPFTVQRLVLFPSNLIRIQYGQATYKTKAEATQAISSEVFVQEQNMFENGLLRAILVINKGTTSLQSSVDAQFFEADRFGAATFSAGGAGTTSLQQAYGNSAKPQITTNATLGSVQIKRGGTADTDVVFEVLNGSGASTYDIKGNGNARTGDIAGGNYSEIETDGTFSMHGNATVFKDLNISGMALLRGGAADPTTINFVDANLRASGFIGTGVTPNRLYGSLEMQHDYKEGSDIEIHVHWTPTTTDIGDVIWQVYYTWQNVDGTFSTGTLLTGPATAAGGTAWASKYTAVGIVSGAGKTMKSLLNLQVFRDPAHASDTYAATAALLQLGIHYECDTIGSRQRNSKS